ncbi:ABC transporter ATP-binding protein [Candidatus Poribacteria bacterium]|nr:ABC transporter ATP-binding protein [Candidatus Poribacteria bacterium]MEE2910398.1 ABC transporter ATP-binding protein [Candidatus Poribacteria bacterium]|tara:strand:+ start:194 stop:874 length:681 start_codon:yes stop_codon:yes gene_type:complete
MLKIRHLKKTFPSPDGKTQTIVDIPDFELNSGQQVALQGQSGCGKTTFLNLISGILQADQPINNQEPLPQIILNGTDIAKLSEQQRDQFRGNSIGYIFQTFNLLPAYTILENVLLGMHFSDIADTELAETMLIEVGLAERLNYRPSQLSVGQQQRVAVVRALAKKPNLVLADEPTGNLDSAQAHTALRLIRQICQQQNAALLLVSHDQDLLDQFDDCRLFSDINCA